MIRGALDWGARLAAVGLLAITAGCGALEPAPLEITFRDSLVGAGKIVQLENTSNEPLTGIEVVIAAPDGQSRTFVLDQLGPYQSFEIGWKKLGGWQIPPGSEIEVELDGHLLPVKGRLPASELESE